MRGLHIRRRPHGWVPTRAEGAARRPLTAQRRPEDKSTGQVGHRPRITATRTEPIRDERQTLERLLREAAADQRVVGFAGGLPSEKLFPRSRLARAFVRAMARAGAPGLQYGWAEGSVGLRAFFAERLGRRGAQVTADDVIVTSGAQQAIAIALQLAVPRGGRGAGDHRTF